MLSTLIKLAKKAAPAEKRLYPAWQGMQYMRNMFDGRAKLEPLVARDPDLWTFAKGLPAAGQGNHSRYALRRTALAHGTSAPPKHADCPG